MIAPHNLSLDELINQIYRDDNQQAIALIDKIVTHYELTELDDIADLQNANFEQQNAIDRLNSAMGKIAHICENEDYLDVEQALAAVYVHIRKEDNNL